MSEEKTGLDLLREVADAVEENGVNYCGAWNGARNPVKCESCNECAAGRLRDIAEQIEGEYVDELDRRRAAEARLDKELEIQRRANDAGERALASLDALIERTGRQDVDVAALRELAHDLDDMPADGGGMQSLPYGSVSRRIFKALEGTPEPDAAREAAADLVEKLGGVGVVDEYRKTLVKIGRKLGYGDGELPELPEMLLGELDRRLMPSGLTWPRWDDGLPVTRDDCPEGVFAVALGLNGECFALLDELPAFDATHCLMLDDAGERVERPAPEVLGADGKPIVKGETVWFAGRDGFFCSVVDGFDVDSEMRVDSLPCGEIKRVAVENVENGVIGFAYPKDLAHEPLDTQERIDADRRLARTPMNYLLNVMGMSLDEANAIPTLDRADFVVDDLLRRQRELDARMGGAE